MTGRATKVELANFQFEFDWNVLGTPEIGEPVKIWEEPLANLQVALGAAGERAFANRVMIKGLDMLWSQLRQGNAKWELGVRTRTVPSPNNPAKTEVYLYHSQEFSRILCQVLSDPRLQIKASLKRETNGRWSDFERAEDSRPLSPWNSGVLPFAFLYGTDQDMRLRLRVNITLDWVVPTGGSSAHSVLIEDAAVIAKLCPNGAKTDVTIVGGDGKPVNFHRSVLAHYGDEILRRLSPVGEISWRVGMEEVGFEAALLLYRLLYGKPVSVVEFRCELAVQLLKVGHNYKMTSVEAAMATLIGQKDKEWFSTDGALKLFFFLKRGEVEGEVKVHQGLMDQVGKILANTRWPTMRESEVGKNMTEWQLDALYEKREEMYEKGMVEGPSTGEPSQEDE